MWRKKGSKGFMTIKIDLEKAYGTMVELDEIFC